ncbi:MAG: hypothetical protein WCG47_18265, partial [Dermatophilaceae bacterium]
VEHCAVLVRADGQQPLLAVVLVLDEPDGMSPCVPDVGLVDAVNALRVSTTPSSTLSSYR